MSQTQNELTRELQNPSQNNTSQLIVGTLESPNAPRPFPCHGPRNLREVEREYNDSVNGHLRA